MNALPTILSVIPQDQLPRITFVQPTIENGGVRKGVPLNGVFGVPAKTSVNQLIMQRNTCTPVHSSTGEKMYFLRAASRATIFVWENGADQHPTEHRSTLEGQICVIPPNIPHAVLCQARGGMSDLPFMTVVNSDAQAVATWESAKDTLIQNQHTT